MRSIDPSLDLCVLGSRCRLSWDQWRSSRSWRRISLAPGRPLFVVILWHIRRQIPPVCKEREKSLQLLIHVLISKVTDHTRKCILCDVWAPICKCTCHSNTRRSCKGTALDDYSYGKHQRERLSWMYFRHTEFPISGQNLWLKSHSTSHTVLYCSSYISSKTSSNRIIY